MDVVTYPTRVLITIGCKNVLVTNAAGGVNLGFKAGDFMLITDHINNSGANPLIGKNVMFDRFPDMSNAYDKEINAKIMDMVTNKLKIDLKKGVYQMNSGPTYETGAEVKMARIWGADAVGMSTVPEVIVAVHMKAKVTAISCITNMGTGILDQPLAHTEVEKIALEKREDFKKVIYAILPILKESQNKK